MGAWGVGLFSDDTAGDVRSDYRELIGDGLDGPAATDRLLATWGTELGDPDVAPVFWLALADAQWRVGRLEDRVKAAALKIIADGSDLRRWAGTPDLQTKRRAVLENLRLQLETPQSPPKRIPKRFRSTCDWAVGEVVAFRLRSGRCVLLRVLDHHVDRGGVSPVCDVLDWIGTDIPKPAVIQRARRRPFFGARADAGDGSIFLGATSSREFPADRILRTGVILESPARRRGAVVVLWRHIDQSLKELFDLE